MILIVILIVTFLGAVLSLVSPQPGRAKWIALATSILSFLLSVFIAATPSLYNSGFKYILLGEMGITFSFGLDGISLLLLLLTTFLSPLIVLSAFRKTYRRPHVFYALILLMELALLGVFTARDGLMFYISWELALIPIYFICGLWGSTDKIKITFKFFVYTLLGSLFMLVALIMLYLATPAPHSFSFDALYAVSMSNEMQTWVFAAFFLAFAIKIPVFPFHTWQPDTYDIAPYQGSMLLAGIMLKMGIYGILRLLIPLCPDALAEWGWLAILLSVTGIVYASIIAIKQDNLKKMVAYASIAHVGLITAGVLTLNIQGLQGGTLQMISHGINVVGLFAMIEMLHVRLKSKNISDMGGIATKAPIMAAFFMIIILGTVALPLTNGFVGEFLLLLGLFEYKAWVAVIAGLTIIFTAIYLLWMNQRVMFGKPGDNLAEFKDLSTREILILSPLVIMIFWIGIYPSTFLHIAEPALLQLIGR
ncbi:MAG: NADH-quinone oxidoreductase subunit M [Bacteroidales bacterium]|nr:NADH-quinone oxidoreductase subunit M [Bacteroidales bacterium]